MKKFFITIAAGLMAVAAMTAQTESPLLPCPASELQDAWNEAFQELASEDSPDRYIVRDVDSDGTDEIVAMGDERHFLAVFRPTPQGLLVLGCVMDSYEDLGYAPGGWSFMQHDFHDGPEKRTIWTSFTQDQAGTIVMEGMAQVVYHMEEGVEDEGCYSINDRDVSALEYGRTVPGDDAITWCGEMTGWRRTTDNELVDDPYANLYANALGVFVWDDNGPTNLREAPKGKVVVSLPDDDEYIYTLLVSDCVNGWLKVVYIGAIDRELPFNMSDYKELWIHNSVIGTSTRNYGGQTLHLYAEPDENAKVTYSFGDETLLHPLETDVDGWVKVRTGDGKHEGWIQREWLCGNPVTNCC